MKRYISIIAIIFMLPTLASACDICGCGVGNNYIGILPDFSKHIIGLRYRYNSMLTHVGVGGSITYLTTKEYYHTAEAWGGWNIGKNIRLMATIPYSFNERTNQGATNNKNGMGDITVSAFYQLVNKRNTVFTNKLLVQSLWIGGGAKLATGKYNPLDKTSNGENANLFQLGTGSYDFTMNAMYDIRLQDAGINVNTGYKVNTANQYQYRYGNKFSINTQAYYKFRMKDKIGLAPNVGIQYERAQADKDKDFTVTVSGGNLLLGTAGIEAVFNKVAVGANYQVPFTQNLASGIVKANNRFMMHVAIAL